jgi:hypothetical protein
MDSSKKTSSQEDISLEAQQLTDKVDRALASGSMSQAKRAFNQNWREAVPELPLRFSVLLEDVQLDNAYTLLKLRRKNKTPQLKLAVNRKKVAVQMVRGRKLIIGYLPKRDSSLLNELGERSFEIYQPRILEAPYKDDGSLSYLAIELVNKKSTAQTHEHTPISVQEAFEEVNQMNDKDDLPF